jgi:hypothetical protein
VIETGTATVITGIGTTSAETDEIGTIATTVSTIVDAGTDGIAMTVATTTSDSGESVIGVSQGEFFLPSPCKGQTGLRRRGTG